MIIARHLISRVEEALADTRIVVIQGARQVGKSTLVTHIAELRGGLVVSLDEPQAANAARLDPVGFIEQNPDGLLVIDEVQRAPELIVTLKAAVDTDKRPGRFLLTGSADLLDLSTSHESLAGRAESLVLYGLSQGEIAGHQETFVDRCFAGDVFSGFTSSMTRADYMATVCAGSFPEALTRAPGRRRQNWHTNYLTRITNRDAHDVSELQRLSELPRILAALAANNAGELVVTTLSNNVGIPRRTLDPYIALLETLYLIQLLPAWSSNSLTRVIHHPKTALLDSGLAAAMLGITPDALSPGKRPELAGGLLEGFVAAEIRKQLTWSEERANIYHFRDQNKREVDIVLETPDGRVVGIEIKARSSIHREDTAGLRHLSQKLGNRFIGGYLLNTTGRVLSLGDGIVTAPIDLIWRA